ncbi:MAG: hypothetical protein J7K15_01545 [Deltaproteobacteria bacterium]|nr:hypothetical protein [Deltaproteobacteria bacterium]
MKKSKIALKPYLDTITGYCSSLSNEELTDIITSLAKDVPTSGRVGFLEKLRSYLPDHRVEMVPEAGEIEQILNDIQALRESIEERIESIEDGSYWEDRDDWEDDEYYDDDPDYVSEYQVEELESFFDYAGSLFLDDRLEDAREVYGAIFSLISDIKEQTNYLYLKEIDTGRQGLDIAVVFMKHRIRKNDWMNLLQSWKLMHPSLTMKMHMMKIIP